MPRHGTEHMYKRYKCRCEECKTAVREATRRRKANHTAVPDHVHGTHTGYSYWSCRCVECLKFWHAYKRPYMQRYREQHREELRARQKQYQAEKKRQLEIKERARRARKVS